jgi:hypothetical protein
MNRKAILAASAAIGLAVAGTPALAYGGDTSIDISKSLEVTKSWSSTIGDISLDFSPTSTSTKTVDVTKVVADQDLSASISNSAMDKVVDIDDGAYNSGDNSVNNSAFAAFAGILNQSWNTGVNANAQAANNLAVQGNTHFNN